MKQIFEKLKQNWDKEKNKIFDRLNIFQGERHVLLAVIIGTVITVCYGVFLSVFASDKFPFLLEETPTALLSGVIVEELVKIFGIYLLISTRKNVNGLSILLVPTMFELIETVTDYWFMGSVWGIFYPLHIITGVVYLKFLRMSKKMLLVAFVINSTLHWVWNIQGSIVYIVSDLTVTIIFYAWIAFAIYAFKTLLNKPEAKRYNS